jgi:hypothetical protein
MVRFSIMGRAHTAETAALSRRLVVGRRQTASKPVIKDD